MSGIDVRPLMKEVNENPALWDEITARQKSPDSSNVDTKSIFVRWSIAMTLEAAFNDVHAVNYPAFEKLPAVSALIDQIGSAANAKRLGRVLLVSLKPGGLVDKHIDEGAYADYYERFHLPLSSEEGNLFYSEWEFGHGEYVHMRPGELWTLNHKKPHWVINSSDKERVHMIVDLVAPDYRHERE